MMCADCRSEITIWLQYCELLLGVLGVVCIMAVVEMDERGYSGIRTVCWEGLFFVLLDAKRLRWRRICCKSITI